MMKITGSQYKQIAKMYQKKASRRIEKGDSNQSDKINLSREGKELKRIHEKLNQTPEVRMEKVKQLRKVVQQGTYQVSGEKIAEKMLEGIIINKVIG